MSTLLNKEEYIKITQKLMGFIKIPAQPQIVADINREINSPNADLSTIADLISKDVTMSAKILRVVNSVFFGLREKVESIDRALALIGMKSFNTVILSSSLREALGGNSPGIEKFWNHSMTTAAYASQIARKVGYHSAELAYLAGLFHDCGVPVLLKTFPQYTETIDLALGIVPIDALSGRSQSVIGIEHDRYKTHHCAIGYLVAKDWNMSDAVLDVIWYHHYVKIDVHKDESTKKLAAILLLADYMSSSLFSYAGGSLAVDPESEWAKMHNSVMSELSMNLDNIMQLKDDLMNINIQSG